MNNTKKPTTDVNLPEDQTAETLLLIEQYVNAIDVQEIFNPFGDEIQNDMFSKFMKSQLISELIAKKAKTDDVFNMSSLDESGVTEQIWEEVLAVVASKDDQLKEVQMKMLANLRDIKCGDICIHTLSLQYWLEIIQRTFESAVVGASQHRIIDGCNALLEDIKRV